MLMSPRTEEQNQHIREESSTRIIRAALEQFATYGYTQTSVKMIASAAGVSQGLLYNYFASKDDLLRAIFAQSMVDVRESFALAEQGSTPADKIARLIRGSAAILRRNTDFWKLSVGVRGQPAVLALLGDALGGWLAEIQATLQRYFVEAGAANPQIEAELLFAVIDGMTQHFVLAPDQYPLEAVAEAAIARFSPGGNQ